MKTKQEQIKDKEKEILRIKHEYKKDYEMLYKKYEARAKRTRKEIEKLKFEIEVEERKAQGEEIIKRKIQKYEGVVRQAHEKAVLFAANLDHNLR